ncbi:MAG: peptide deformylase [Candidatus Omnitrophica bacterium]|nr:peptide deformylase [Candidatus Omnitrophota bacterium]MBU4472694.1 peptide deformylase [Candidatus Omnitrophota bacterium]MCG2705976.1 peptide deformylase [Candidatus Omnitrophota bacterium]
MKETRLRIRLLGDPALRKKSRPVANINQRHQDILGEMARLMYVNSGIGLAAPQVGINEAMIVVDIGSGLYKLINPKIVSKSGHQVMEEGCLSIPGVCIKVKRAQKVLLEAQDEEARPVAIEAQGLLACVFQHEIEHLSARLTVDHTSFFEKLKLRKRLTALRKRSKDEELSESKTKSCQLQL